MKQTARTASGGSSSSALPERTQGAPPAPLQRLGLLPEPRHFDPVPSRRRVFALSRVACLGVACLGLAWASSGRAEETMDPAAKAPSAGLEAHKAKAAPKPEAKVAPGQAVAAPAQAAPEDALIKDLHGKEDAALGAVHKLGALETPRATEILLNELSLGLPPKVAGAVLDVLAQRRPVQSEALLPLLSLYARHRNPELRKRAVSALAALVLPPQAAAQAPGAAEAPANKGVDKAPAKVADKGKRPAAPVAPVLSPAQQAAVVPLLIAALSDASAEVRGVAAEALGGRREKAAEPALIKLLLRKDPAAPAALGQIGGPETARALAEMIGNVPDRLITETLGLLLLRPDFGPDPLRLEVVKTLGKMSSSQPIDVLNDYVQATAKDKADKARPSRNEAQKIIEQRTAK